MVLFFYLLLSLHFSFKVSYANSYSKTPNTLGVPGLIDMPTAGSFHDGRLGFSSSKVGPHLRNTLTFQALPRVFGAFRYSGVGDRKADYFENSGYTYWDRSFDLRVDLLKESTIIPDLTIGMQDIIGTGLYSGEYLVASKNIFNLRLSGGLGWGRLATKNTIHEDNNRISKTGGAFGGLLRTEQLFKGNIGAFGGLEYKSSNGKFTIKAEISSDDYSFDKNLIRKLPKNDINYGINYKLNEAIDVSSYYGYDKTIGLQVSLSAIPAKAYGGNFLEGIPEPFYSEPYKFEEKDKSYWTEIETDLDAEKIIPLAYKEEKNEVIIIISNNHFSTNTQAIGRTLRILSKFIPMSKNLFTVIMSKNDIPILSVSVDRNEIDLIIDAPNSELLTSRISKIGDAGKNIKNANEFKNLVGNNFSWSISPYYRLHLFDPDKPFYYDIGPEFGFSYKLKPGFYLNANFQDSLLSTFDQISRGPKGSLPKVRSDSKNYLNVGKTRINDLTLSSYYKLPYSIYGRTTIGYLETMYAGLSSEFLFSQYKTNYALGMEINYLKARGYDQRLTFRQLNGLSRLNGHLSGYWDTGYYNYLAQLDYGKYLAGDTGGTLTLSRNFSNGWKVGGFFTLTDAKFAEFGEGSFDKGIFFSIPFNSITPIETVDTVEERIKPIQGDGGARVDVTGRLYDILHPYKKNMIETTWSSIWR